MKLIGSITSPYVRKVRVVMAEKKLDSQFVQEDVWSPRHHHRPPTRSARCPAWSWKAARRVFDSRVIVEYLDTLSPSAS